MLVRPTNTSDVATKGYVDGAIDSEGIVLGLDITGLGYDAVQGGGATYNILTLIEEIASGNKEQWYNSLVILLLTQQMQVLLYRNDSDNASRQNNSYFQS